MRTVRILLVGTSLALLLSAMSVFAGDRPAGAPAVRILNPGVLHQTEIMSSHMKPAGHQPKLSRIPSRIPIPSEGIVCVFKDADPWDIPAEEDILSGEGIPFEVHSSDDFGSLDFSVYKLIIVCGDQPQEFYDAYAGYVAKFEAYVAGGGFLNFCAADSGWNNGYLEAPLPGGMIWNGECFNDYNFLEDPTDDLVYGVANPFYGTSASHGYFSNLPMGSQVVAYAEGCDDNKIQVPAQAGLPTLVQYTLGCGMVNAFAQPLEYGYVQEEDSGQILINSMEYYYYTRSCYDLIYVDDFSRSRLCVNSQTGAFVYKVLSGTGKGEYAGQAYLSMRNGVLFINSTTLNPRLQFYDNQNFHKAYGSFIKGTLRSYLDDRSTLNNPATCQ